MIHVGWLDHIRLAFNSISICTHCFLDIPTATRNPERGPRRRRILKVSAYYTVLSKSLGVEVVWVAQQSSCMKTIMSLSCKTGFRKIAVVWTSPFRGNGWKKKGPSLRILNGGGFSCKEWILCIDLSREKEPSSLLPRLKWCEIQNPLLWIL